MFVQLTHICLQLKVLKASLDEKGAECSEELRALLDDYTATRDDLIGRLVAPY